MKRTALLLTIMIFINLSTNAQLLKGIGSMVKAKAAQKVTGAVEKKVDKILGTGSDAKSEEQVTAKNRKSENPSNMSVPLVKAYSKYDFVAGDKVMYFEDFSSSATGELPLGWNATGKGEVVSLEGQSGKWLRMFPGSLYLSGNTKSLGENYTIEFDVLMNGTPPSGTRFLPTFNLGLLSSGKLSTTHNSLIGSSAPINNRLEITIKPNVDKISTIKLESSGPNKISTFKSDTRDLSDFNETLERVVHYSMQIQKQRFRMWIDGVKVFDVPQAVNINPALNQLFFKPAEYWMYNDDNYGLYLSNFRIASSNPDLRKALISNGSFSTSGIFFESGSSTISPQSFGLLKEISQVMNENKEAKFKIVGYTDNNGDAATNLMLSKDRAEAVKNHLVSQFNINISNLSIEGKGATLPVADNKTQEGKAQNRRVEFIKI
jgi:OOP family OmpA-OmpF porin